MTGEGARGAGRRPGGATLEDVARAAGVSTATVSRCLNAPGKLQPATRARVEAAIAELGYAPNFGARALAARRTDTMGAVVPTLENAIFARGLEAFQLELAREGTMLLVASSGYDPATEAEEVRLLVARGAEGLLLIGYDRDPAVYEFLRRRGVPYVVAWVHDAREPHPAIGFDNEAAMRELAGEVLARGHRRIGFVTARLAGNDRARGRLAGLRAAMAARGLDPDALVVHETTYAIESGREGLRALMAAPDRPTAVMCGNDVLAAGALDAARDMGLRVPGDLSVTGFDDIEIAQIVTPRLTTVHVPHREMGRGAAAMLRALAAGEDTGGARRLEVAIRLRETLGPPPR